MSQKLITDLQLRDSFSDDVSLAVQDSVQTYRNTGAQVADFLSGILSKQPSFMKNLGVFASASSGSLLISARQADGISHPGSSSSSRSEAVFRSTTLTSGGYTVRQYTSALPALTMIVPSGATLSAQASYAFHLYVYLYYDGTADGICISTSRLDETVLHNISAITGSSNSAGVYATDATTNAAVRLIGGIRWNSISTPGTWVTPSTVFTTYLENGLLTPDMSLSLTTGSHNISAASANRIRERMTREVSANADIGGIAISSSNSGFYTTTSTNYQTVTNLSVSLKTSGRPVMLQLLSDDIGSGIGLEGETSSPRMLCRFLRGSTPIGRAVIGARYLPVSSVSFLDRPSAGTHTYTFQVAAISGSGMAVVAYAKLMAYEL